MLALRTCVRDRRSSPADRSQVKAEAKKAGVDAQSGAKKVAVEVRQPSDATPLICKAEKAYNKA